jgi:hypothetical protein
MPVLSAHNERSKSWTHRRGARVAVVEVDAPREDGEPANGDEDQNQLAGVEGKAVVSIDGFVCESSTMVCSSFTRRKAPAGAAQVQAGTVGLGASPGVRARRDRLLPGELGLGVVDGSVRRGVPPGRGIGVGGGGQGHDDDRDRCEKRGTWAFIWISPVHIRGARAVQRDMPSGAA